MLLQRAGIPAFRKTTAAILPFNRMSAEEQDDFLISIWHIVRRNRIYAPGGYVRFFLPQMRDEIAETDFPVPDLNIARFLREIESGNRCWLCGLVGEESPKDPYNACCDDCLMGVRE